MFSRVIIKKKNSIAQTLLEEDQWITSGMESGSTLTLTFLMTEHLNLYDNIFFKRPYLMSLLVNCCVFSPILKREEHFIIRCLDVYNGIVDDVRLYLSKEKFLPFSM